MLRLQVHPEFEALLRRHGLNNHNAIMHCDAGDLVERAQGRDTREIDLDGQPFFLKRVYQEKFSAALESYFGGKLAHSKPYKEMLHYRFLRDAGFDVAEVVAVGEKLRLGIPVSGFIMTAKVEGKELSQVFQQADRRGRRRIACAFGTLVGRLHHRGFFGSIRLKDVICNGSPGDRLQMTLIDREVRNPFPRRVTRKRVLSRLMLNIRRQTSQGELLTRHEWNLFSRFYCQQLATRLQIGHLFLGQEIVQLVDRISQRNSS